MSSSASLPTFADVEAAAARIAGRVHRTPVLTSATLNRELGAEIFFKCENLQKIGAFKARGATNTVLQLSEAECARGVVTHSSGNHAAAVAFAAQQRGVSSVVVMPESAPRIKVDAVRGYGAQIRFCAQSERQAVADEVLAETGGTFIHPFEDPRVIAGQGTAALELIEDVPDLDAVIAPIGGGGLIAGTTLTCAARLPGKAVYGAEPRAVDDAFRSLRDGVRHPAVENPETICDGLLTGLGSPNFTILQAAGVQVVVVDESEVVDAAQFHLQRMKTLVEPSGATCLAALRRLKDRIRGQRVGAIITGGNTDMAWLERAG